MEKEIDQRLAEMFQMRDEIKDLLQKKIAQLTNERDEMVAQYDDDIGRFQIELKRFDGSVRIDGPNDVGVRAYNFLLEHAGQQFTSGKLMASIHSVSAVASVVLRPFIDRKQVLTSGSGRGTTYYVEAASVAS